MFLLTLVLGCAVHDAHHGSAPSFTPLSRERCIAVLHDGGDVGTLREAARATQRYFENQPDGPALIAGGSVSTAALRRTASVILEATMRDGDHWREAVCDELTLYHRQDAAAVLTTAYYTPILPARRGRSARFCYPLFRPPPDLVTGCEGVGRMVDGRLVPYYSRAQIDAGAIDAYTEVLAWLDDPVEVFFLQVQGSGVLQLEDGSAQPVGYAASNGLAHRSIGRLLVERGLFTAAAATMPAIKAYLRAHPDQQREILTHNERYIFFASRQHAALGSSGVILTPGRSLAADPQIYPPGVALYLRFPGGSGPPAQHPRLAFVQDQGAAITGPGRLDLYLGTGPGAGEIAGRFRAATDVYWLLPRGMSARVPDDPQSMPVRPKKVVARASLPAPLHGTTAYLPRRISASMFKQLTG